MSVTVPRTKGTEYLCEDVQTLIQVVAEECIGMSEAKIFVPADSELESIMKTMLNCGDLDVPKPRKTNCYEILEYSIQCGMVRTNVFINDEDGGGTFLRGPGVKGEGYIVVRKTSSPLPKCLTQFLKIIVHCDGFGPIKQVRLFSDDAPPEFQFKTRLRCIRQ